MSTDVEVSVTVEIREWQKTDNPTHYSPNDRFTLVEGTMGAIETLTAGHGLSKSIAPLIMVITKSRRGLSYN